MAGSGPAPIGDGNVIAAERSISHSTILIQSLQGVVAFLFSVS